jgi:hypothetical protein
MHRGICKIPRTPFLVHANTNKISRRSGVKTYSGFYITTFELESAVPDAYINEITGAELH